MASNILLSVIITSFKDNNYLKKILNDLENQDLNHKNFEILLLSASQLSENIPESYLTKFKGEFRFWCTPNLSRTKALNFLVRKTKSNLVVRVDSRTHIKSDYLLKIYSLSIKKNVANVGGLMMPIGLNSMQKLIAEGTKHPLMFGGGQFRNKKFSGFANTVYLGAFNKKLMPKQPWFEEDHPKISEDSDLNYRIITTGNKIYMDSSIIAYHYPRENLSSFFKLSFNYGVGRGLFFIKHKSLSAFRQLLIIIASLTFIVFFILGFLSSSLIFHQTLAIAVITYLLLIALIAKKITKNNKYYIHAISLFFGCHIFWVLGFYYSPITYFQYKKK